MLVISEQISLSEKELHFTFCRSSGPGGQNVNKVSTAVELRFNVIKTAALAEDVISRLINIAGSRMTRVGILLIVSQRFRTQERNRQDAIDRLIQLIRKAAKKPALRIKTRPTTASKENRIRSKQVHKIKKNFRKPVNPFE
jgi:ribosome-associated protein